MKDFAIITGASSNHFGPLKHLLDSIRRYEPGTHVRVYDLGLGEHERAELSAGGWAVPRFDFENYPDHFQMQPYTGNLAKRSWEAGHYAWKPVIIARELLSHRSVLWLDAGNLLHSRVDGIRSELHRCGFYSPVTDGGIARWTRPETLDWLGATEEGITRDRNRCGAIVGVNGMNPEIAELVGRWADAAMYRECIAPHGATWHNNRCDQAILSVLVAQWREQIGAELVDEFIDVTIHNDMLSDEEFRSLTGRVGRCMVQLV